MMPFVITLTGASQCGKSTAINIFQELSKEDRFPGFYPVSFQKYTTREFRSDEIERINIGEEVLNDQRPVIGKHNEVEGLFGEELFNARRWAFQQKKCDLAYEQYGDRYGLRLDDLYVHLKRGETPIVVLNDVRTVEDIKTKLGGQCFSLFIFREAPILNNFKIIGAKRHEPIEKTETRYKKAELIYRIYIENIHVFDKLILNSASTESIECGSNDSLRRIIERLTMYLCEPIKEFKEAL